jgi:hypothetical protein
MKDKPFAPGEIHALQTADALFEAIQDDTRGATNVLPIRQLIAKRLRGETLAKIPMPVKYPTEGELRATETRDSIKWLYIQQGPHTRVRIFMNGGLCGVLIFSNEEFKIVMKRLVGMDGFEFTEEPS